MLEIAKMARGVAAYGRSIVSGKETGEEASAHIERRARVSVIASNDAVVLGLEVEFEDITLLSLNLLRVELVIAGSCDFNSLGAGQVSQNG